MGNNSNTRCICGSVIEGDLVRELESRGITVNNWNILDGVEGELIESNWWDSEETRKWVVETCLELIEKGNDASQSQTETPIKLDGKALARLSGICGGLTVYYEGSDLDVLSKDLAIIAYKVCKLQNILDPNLDIYLQLLIFRGRYLDSIDYFKNQLSQSIYDETFLPDMVDMLVTINQLYQNVKDMQPEEFNKPLGQSWALSKIMAMAQIISRGAFLQLESGLGTISISAANKFVTDLAPHFSTIILRYQDSEWMQGVANMYQHNHMHNTLKQYMSAYSMIIFRNLTPLDVADEAILDTADKACMDEIELEPIDAFHTLFGHIIRLRLLASSEFKDRRWDNAVTQAQKAIQRTESLANFSHRQGSLETLMSLIETGRITDIRFYADSHSTDIDFL